MSDNSELIEEKSEKKGGGCSPIILILGALLVFVIGICAITGGLGGDGDETVTLDPPAGSTTVQMFDEDGNVKRTFSSGTECDVLGTYKWVEAGIEVPLYELRCNGVTGYINRKWTR